MDSSTIKYLKLHKIEIKMPGLGKMIGVKKSGKREEKPTQEPRPKLFGIERKVTATGNGVMIDWEKEAPPTLVFLKRRAYEELKNNELKGINYKKLRLLKNCRRSPENLIFGI